MITPSILKRSLLVEEMKKQCDITLTHSDPMIIRTVSQAHLEIFYDQGKK